MSDPYRQFSLVGQNASGNALSVTLYAKSQEGAEQEYAFRYGGLGYKLHDRAKEDESAKPVRVRTRKPRKVEA